MQLIRSEDYVTMPWKNGLGVTREIFSARTNGTLSWRLSLAEVSADGPFSRFEGLERILTVVKGDGMRLQTSDGEIDARPLCPVRFPGDIDVTGQCRSFPIQNFNLIFNPGLTNAEVRIVSELGDENPQKSSYSTQAIFLLEGELTIGPNEVLSPGGSCVLTENIKLQSSGSGFKCVLVSLTNR